MDRAAIQERFGILGTSAAIRQVLDQVRLVARTDVSVLVQGESGVGKELIATAVHQLSPRRHRSLVVVNCGAIPEGLIESELFGAEKGAYTGANERRTGYFEAADGGTIFLDEIGEMPLAAQVRLLRVLESGEFSRVGSSQVQRTDARVIAATNKDLAHEVQRGRFREDLFYRLSTVIIRIPPLRERSEDILPIFERFVYDIAQRYNTPARRLDDGARALLMRYRWPGNVRELRNVAERTVVLLTNPTVTAEDLRPFLRGVDTTGAPGGLVPLGAARDASGDPDGSRERELVYRALLELRTDLATMKDQLATLLHAFRGVVPARAMLNAPAPPPPDEGYVGYRTNVADEDRTPMIEDVPFEWAADEPNGQSNGQDAPAPADPVEAALAADTLPTLADAERQLITEAIKRYDGNRRQTAKALGISERTLYRKLKEFDEEL